MQKVAKKFILLRYMPQKHKIPEMELLSTLFLRSCKIKLRKKSWFIENGIALQLMQSCEVNGVDVWRSHHKWKNGMA